ncbi:ABC transporter substrate-binding protein [Leeia sp.]|uniref:ABC transporter substrate-binding protein n=1 Tax=Leeia sp. TaxID=2884678 RepID=UPI0035AE873C
MMMKSILSYFYKAGLLLGLLLPLGQIKAETVTDLAGRQVKLPAKVERIVLGEGRLLYTLALLEGKQPLKRIAGWQGDLKLLDGQTYRQYQKQFPEIERIPLIGKADEESVSSEKVLAVRPDLAIFTLAGHGPDVDSKVLHDLEKAGVPVVFVDFRVSPLTHTVPSMRLLGKALQREQEAERFIGFYQQEMDKVRQALTKLPGNQRPAVLVDLRGGSMPQMMSPGKGSLGEMVAFAGGRNLAADWVPGAMGEVSVEKVLAARPPFYLLTGANAPDAASGLKMGAEIDARLARDSLLQTARRGQLGQLPAIRQGQVLGAWHHFYNTPLHVVLVQAMARWMHPDLMQQVNPQQTWLRLHQQFLAVAPSGTYWVSGH